MSSFSFPFRKAFPTSHWNEGDFLTVATAIRARTKPLPVHPLSKSHASYSPLVALFTIDEIGQRTSDSKTPRPLSRVKQGIREHKSHSVYADIEDIALEGPGDSVKCSVD